MTARAVEEVNVLHEYIFPPHWPVQLKFRADIAKVKHLVIAAHQLLPKDSFRAQASAL